MTTTPTAATADDNRSGIAAEAAIAASIARTLATVDNSIASIREIIKARAKVERGSRP